MARKRHKVQVIVCFGNPVLRTGSQKEILALSCFLCFTGGSVLQGKEKEREPTGFKG